MRIIIGDLWSELGVADLILVTTNCIFNANGHLVMGDGIAKQAKERFPEAPKMLAAAIQKQIDMAQFYGVVSYRISREKNHYLGAFQTKYNWRNPSTLELIEQSTMRLRLTAHKFERIVLPYLPGCGFGGLPEDEVLSVISTLPDNVFVYRKLEVQSANH